MRLLAALIDTVLALVLTALLSSTTGWYFAERAVVTFRVYSSETIWNGPIPLMLGAISTITYGFAFALTVVLLGEGIWAASVGKNLTRLTVVAAPGPKAGRVWGRYLLKLSPCIGFCIALISGWWPLAAIALALGGWSVVDLLLSVVLRRPLWYDRLTGTRVAKT